MSLFLRSKTPLGVDNELIRRMVTACREHAAGKATAPLPVDAYPAPLDELAQALNEALGGGTRQEGGADDRIGQTLDHVNKVRNGDFETRLIGIEGDDSVAELMYAVNDLTDIVDAFVREAGASLEAVSNNIYYRKIFTTGLHGGFLHTATMINDATRNMDRQVSEYSELTHKLVNNIQEVAAAAVGMETTVETVSEIAGDTSERSATVASAAAETNQSVNMVVASAEEMQTSIGEMTRQMNQTAEITTAAIRQMEESNRVMQELSQAANDIGDVVSLINDIASQTNLLALNATIEAARAGDAGRGFAVVANEVKSLATQTAKATENITRQVMEMQSATSETVKSMGTVGSTIGEINTICSAVVAAVAEQEATTREITGSMAAAAESTRTVAENIQSVQEGASRNSQMADALRATATQLSTDSRALAEEAREFLARSA